MKLTTVLLCDVAVVKKGMLYVVGGGVSVVDSPTVPFDLRLTLAFILELDRSELTQGYVDVPLTVIVRHVDGDPITVQESRIRTRRVWSKNPLDTVSLPRTVDLQHVTAHEWGIHRLELTVGTATASLEFAVLQSPLEIKRRDLPN
jgi:hypothetical protein